MTWMISASEARSGGANGLTGSVGAGSAAAAGGVGTPIRRSPFMSRRGRGSSARVIGRENISSIGRKVVGEGRIERGRRRH
nr:hypothetical protein Itr_chr08CG15170 [Ipomoea trifida]